MNLKKHTKGDDSIVYGYIRVSTDKQALENQQFEIEQWALKNGVTIDAWIKEVVSGSRKWDKRQLGSLLHTVKPHDTIVCSELSRLGRSLYMIMDILSYCMEREVIVQTARDNFKLCDDIQSKVLAFAFGLSAEIERQLISQRTKEALAARKAAGMKLGRPVGSRNKHTKLMDKDAAIRELLASGHSIAFVSRLLSVDRSTLSRYCKRNNICTRNKICYNQKKEGN